MSYIPASVDFSKYTNLPPEDYGVIEVRFGADSPLLEVELNEAQILSRNFMKNFLIHYFGNGILEVSKYNYESSTSTLALESMLILFGGNLIRVIGDRVNIPNDSNVVLNVREIMKSFNDTLYPYGNMNLPQSDENYFIDSRIGTTTSHRTVLEFKISTQAEAGFNSLVIGTVSNSVFTPSQVVPDIYKLLHKGTYEGSASDLVKDIDTKANKIIEVKAGDGLEGGGNLTDNRTLKIKSNARALTVTPQGLGLTIIDDLTTGGVDVPVSAEMAKTLNMKIDAVSGGGNIKLLKNDQDMQEFRHKGVLPKGGKTIAVGARLFNPTLFLDGVREDSYTVDLATGTLILTTDNYAKYDVEWIIVDKYPFHISFCYQTMNLLKVAPDILAIIKPGMVIKILGESDADDGGHYLVKCENTAKLNAVDIGEGRFLNEIPNTRMIAFRNDINSIWGGKYGGGLIEDTSVPKVVGQRYIGSDGKAYYCKVSSHINNATNYIPCNLTEHMGKLNFLCDTEQYTLTYANYSISFTRVGCMTSVILIETSVVDRSWLEVIVPPGVIPTRFIPKTGLVLTIYTAANTGPFRIKFDGDGALTVLHRYGGNSVIYNNQIESCAFSYLSKATV